MITVPSCCTLHLYLKCPFLLIQYTVSLYLYATSDIYDYTGSNYPLELVPKSERGQDSVSAGHGDLGGVGLDTEVLDDEVVEDDGVTGRADAETNAEAAQVNSETELLRPCAVNVGVSGELQAYA